MKRMTWFAGIVLMSLALTGCSGGQGAPPTSAADSSSALDTSYEGALPLRNQLALGTLRLEETDQPVTAAQAGEMLLVWQALRGTMGSGASAPAEVDALLAQLEGALTAEQLAAIGALHLTQSDLQAWAQSQGLSTGSGSGMGSGQQGEGQSLSPEARATRQAEREAAGGTGSGASQALIDAVIGLLQSK
ncbi:MAG TPA: hypothetical protein PKO09_13290 [Anaerolineae bacterium]|nr:hypothetical protein [Anaerolineae bacterium]